MKKLLKPAGAVRCATYSRFSTAEQGKEGLSSCDTQDAFLAALPRGPEIYGRSNHTAEAIERREFAGRRGSLGRRGFRFRRRLRARQRRRESGKAEHTEPGLLQHGTARHGRGGRRGVRVHGVPVFRGAPVRSRAF